MMLLIKDVIAVSLLFGAQKIPAYFDVSVLDF